MMIGRSGILDFRKIEARGISPENPIVIDLSKNAKQESKP